jgi:hypothetical protein
MYEGPGLAFPISAGKGMPITQKPRRRPSLGMPFAESPAVNIPGRIC